MIEGKEIFCCNKIFNYLIIKYLKPIIFLFYYDKKLFKFLILIKYFKINFIYYYYKAFYFKFLQIVNIISVLKKICTIVQINFC